MSDQIQPKPIDFTDERTVPLLALELLSASTTSTANLTMSLLESANRRADKAERELAKARSDADNVHELHGMLADPRYARRLIRLLYGDLDYMGYSERGEDDAEPR